MIRLYDSLLSGNCYKVRLLLNQLSIPFERVNVNILENETHTPEFLSKNPNGCVPVLETESGEFLTESNAIIAYLSEGTEFTPKDKFRRAQVWQWLFFEQTSLEPYLGSCRYWISILGKANEYQDAINEKLKHGYKSLNIMEKHLTNKLFFVGDCYTIADIALFAYTHVAEEGRFDLTKFSAIQNWLERVKNQPRHISITQL